MTKKREGAGKWVPLIVQLIDFLMPRPVEGYVRHYVRTHNVSHAPFIVIPDSTTPDKAESILNQLIDYLHEVEAEVLK